MERNLKKSVIATGLAATTIISGSLSHQVKAEEIKKDSAEPKTSEVITKPVSETDLQSAQMQADAAKVQADTQKEVVEKVKEDLTKAEEASKEAEKAVAEAEQNKEEATAETIETAKEAVKTAQETVSEHENAVETAEQEAEAIASDVKNQENVVSGQQTLVDVAQSELDAAKTPVAREEGEVSQAKEQEKQAEENLANSQKALEQVKDEVAKLPQAMENAKVQVQAAENQVANTQAAINQKNAELAQAQSEAASNRNVDLSKATYSEFLQDAKNRGANQAIRDAAAKALAAYERAQREDGITVSSDPTSPGTLENNIKAIELVNAINAYRRRAGLHELLIDPYMNPASQVQTLYFERENWHQFKYFGNENVAISFTPQRAVDFWYSEKARYQEIAAQYGLPTNEAQLDANAIYMRVGANVFARIGHYVQMLDNKANAISAAYDRVPNQYSSINGTSEVGFHNVRNFNDRVANGTLLNAGDYERALRNYVGGNSAQATAKLNALKSELALLQAQKTSQESAVAIQKTKLAELQNQAGNQATALANANARVITAEAVLAKARQNVANKEAALQSALASIATAVAPKQAALEKAQAVLRDAESKLADLQAVLAGAQANIQTAKANLQSSQADLQAANDRVAKLENAPQVLAEAQAALKIAQVDYSSKAALLTEEETKLGIYQAVYDKLQASYDELLKQYIAANPGVLTAVRGAGAGVDKSEATVQASQAVQQAQALNSKPSYATDPVLVKQAAGAQGQVGNDSGLAGQKTLPSTGMKADQIGALGMMLGLASLAGAGFKRKKKAD